MSAHLGDEENCLARPEDLWVVPGTSPGNFEQAGVWGWGVGKSVIGWQQCSEKTVRSCGNSLPWGQLLPPMISLCQETLSTSCPIPRWWMCSLIPSSRVQKKDWTDLSYVTTAGLWPPVPVYLVSRLDLLLSGPSHCLQHSCISPPPSAFSHIFLPVLLHFHLTQRMGHKSSPFLLRGIS